MQVEAVAQLFRNERPFLVGQDFVKTLLLVVRHDQAVNTPSTASRADPSTALNQIQCRGLPYDTALGSSHN